MTKTACSIYLKRLRVLICTAFLCMLWFIGFVLKRTLLNASYLRFLAWLTLRTGLFDRDYYLQTNLDVSQAGIDPLLHFLQYGQREGRNPHALFDTRYYRSRVSGKIRFISAVLHYSYIGRFQDSSPNEWFDPVFYRCKHPSGESIGHDTLRQFINLGNDDRISPSPFFDVNFYLEAYPEVAVSGMNALEHYLRVGILDGRTTTPDEMRNNDLIPTSVDSILFNADLRKVQKKTSTIIVDVIVPVYGNLHETLRCIESLINASCSTAYEITVINDGTSDPVLVSNLESLAKKGFFTLLHNTVNQGFVYTANRGMALHADRDVILVNSDTQVFGNWIDRIMDLSCRQPRAGTITPLSNNATICSYPYFNQNNRVPLEISYEKLDRLCSEINSGFSVEAPTGVGFCLYIRRECIKEVGYLDESAFGWGYGEENDFCQRAIRLGWKNLILTDVYVYHLGSASFKNERPSRIKAALDIINIRYPDYQNSIQFFCRTDPLKPYRKALDIARLRAQSCDKNILMVSHNRGGGTLRCIEEESLRLRAEGFGVFYLRPIKGHPDTVCIKHPMTQNLVNLPHYRLSEKNELVDLLKELRITVIQKHSLIDFDANAADHIIELSKAIGASLQVNIHDYKVICPRINLVAELIYCGEPDIKSCDKCLQVKPNEFGVKNITLWRQQHQRLLQFAEVVKVPDVDVAQRLGHYFSGLNLKIESHDNINFTSDEFIRPKLYGNDPLRIVVIGAIGAIKGFEVLLGCAQHAKKMRLPLQFILMGYGKDNDKLIRAGVQVHGRYSDNQASQLLKATKAHVAFLPSVWPETYSYVLSLALSARLPTFAFDIGAIASRLSVAGLSGGLIPLHDAFDTRRINERLLDYRNECIES